MPMPSDKLIRMVFVRLAQITSGFTVSAILLYLSGQLSLAGLGLMLGAGIMVSYFVIEYEQRIIQRLLDYFVTKSEAGKRSETDEPDNREAHRQAQLPEQIKISQNAPLTELLWHVSHSEKMNLLQTGRLATEKDYLTDIIRNLPFPLIILDSRAYVTQCNIQATEMFDTVMQDKPIAFFLNDNDLIEKIEAATQAETNFAEAELSWRGHKKQHFAVLISNFSADDRHRTAMILIDRSAAKEAEQMRVDFVANVSHELRTPLTSVLGFVETLQGPAGEDPETRASFLNILKNQSERMIRLVADQLSLSSIERVESVQPETSAQLNLIAERVSVLLNQQAEAAECRIRLDMPDAAVIVRGDTDELTQMVQNLVENAIRYGAHAGEVRIIIHAEDRWADAPAGPSYACISIEDDGEGIDQIHIPRLTERFYRVDKGRSREKGGTGLGLAIVKHIVSRHRGHLQIDSEKGQGTRFSVFLPHADSSAFSDQNL